MKDLTITEINSNKPILTILFLYYNVGYTVQGLQIVQLKVTMRQEPT